MNIKLSAPNFDKLYEDVKTELTADDELMLTTIGATISVSEVDDVEVQTISFDTDLTEVTKLLLNARLLEIPFKDVMEDIKRATKEEEVKQDSLVGSEPEGSQDGEEGSTAEDRPSDSGDSEQEEVHSED